MKKAHFIGICGVGMSGVAKLLKDLGWDISGSDDDFYPPVSTLLDSYGLSFRKGYRKENIPKGVELIVIGKNAKLVSEENEEVNAALTLGVTIRSFPEVLEGLTQKTRNLIIAGSYGKSTCAGLLAWCLLRAGKDPSYFIGAQAFDLKDTAHIGSDKLFVLEGDEYPSSNWDSTSKFLYYNPHDVLLTSAEHDHVNVFPTHEEYLLPFTTLLSLLPKDGHIIVNADEKHALSLASKFKQSVTYGLSEEAQWRGHNIVYGEKTTFDLSVGGKHIISLTTVLLGAHNVQNIVGVAAMLLEKELVTPLELKKGVATFTGISRRLDLKTRKSTVRVYEGFGSSYEKARAAIKALKLHFPKQRLIVVFEPHTFSWRNKDAITWYDTVFADCDYVLVYEPPSQGAQTHKQLTQDEIVERIKKTSTKVDAINNEEETLELLETLIQDGDVILLVTSGDLGGLIKSIPDFVCKKFPK